MSTLPVSSFYGPVHVAISWPDNRMQGVDVDITALAYTADGNQLDVAYFKKPTALNGSIGTMGDDQKSYNYSNDKEGVFVHLHLLPPECNFVFFMVSARNGVNNLQESGCAMRVSDGSVQGGNFIATAPLNMPQESCLAAVVMRGPAHLYPPSWQLQITSGFPVAAGKGRDFNESIGLVEEYLKSCIPPEMLMNRPPNNPMEKFDMNKMDAYFLDPNSSQVSMQLGWDTTCDLDVHCHLLDEWYQKEAHVYYNNLNDRGVRHSGNQHSSSGWLPGNPEEIIYLNLNEIADDVKYAVFCVHIRQGEIYYETNEEGVQEERRRPPPDNFSTVSNCFARFCDDQNNYQLANFQLNHDGMPGRTRIMCVLQRYGADRRWNLIPLGMPMQQSPTSSSAVRAELIRQTRQDLLRPIRIKFGVIRGTEMKACDGKTSDPYFQCKFYDDTKKKTKTIKKTLEPEWNHPDMYDWTGPTCDLLERIYAKLDVYDKDMFRDDFMGRAYLHAREVIGTRGRGVVQKWLTLGDKHTAEGEQSTGVLDGMLGNTCNTGKILVQWEVTAA